ncbi:collagen alpha-1(I) chain-like [Passer domesticus]|uniref:collagen alpha-1(I) chain-like n=1 Tax=Passer domesticus TaxID=48849 RepID=UPI0030FEA4B7
MKNWEAVFSATSTIYISCIGSHRGVARCYLFAAKQERTLQRSFREARVHSAELRFTGTRETLSINNATGLAGGPFLQVPVAIPGALGRRGPPSRRALRAPPRHAASRTGAARRGPARAPGAAAGRRPRSDGTGERGGRARSRRRAPAGGGHALPPVTRRSRPGRAAALAPPPHPPPAHAPPPARAPAGARRRPRPPPGSPPRARRGPAAAPDGAGGETAAPRPPVRRGASGGQGGEGACLFKKRPGCCGRRSARGVKPRPAQPAPPVPPPVAPARRALARWPRWLTWVAGPAATRRRRRGAGGVSGARSPACSTRPLAPRCRGWRCLSPAAGRSRLLPRQDGARAGAEEEAAAAGAGTAAAATFAH